MGNKKKRKEQKITEVPPGLSTDDLEGTFEEIQEDKNQTIKEEIDKAKAS